MDELIFGFAPGSVVPEEINGCMGTIDKAIVHWGFPAVFPDGLLTDERNALVLDDVIDLFAHEGAVRAFDRQRLVVTLGLVSLSL